MSVIRGEEVERGRKGEEGGMMDISSEDERSRASVKSRCELFSSFGIQI